MEKDNKLADTNSSAHVINFYSLTQTNNLIQKRQRFLSNQSLFMINANNFYIF